MIQSKLDVEKVVVEGLKKILLLVTDGEQTYVHLFVLKFRYPKDQLLDPPMLSGEFSPVGIATGCGV